MPSPDISVLMPVYNGARYLREAVDSILNQSFSDFELIIVDDGSTDETAEILDTYSDPRIIRLRHERNLGIGAARNRGLGRAGGQYLALMDADDISSPERLAVQLEYFRKFPTMGLVGSQARLVDAKGEHIGQTDYPTDPVLVSWLTNLAQPFCLAANLYRRELIDRAGRYDESYLVAGDFDLLLRLDELAEFLQIKESLYTCRVHSEGLTGRYSSLQEKNAAALIRRRLSQFFGTPLSDGMIFSLRQLVGSYWPGTRPVSRASIDVLLQLLQTFIARRKIDLSGARRLKEHLSQALINFACHEHGPLGQYALQQATGLRSSLPIHFSSSPPSTEPGDHRGSAHDDSVLPPSILILSDWEGELNDADRRLIDLLKNLPPDWKIMLVGHAQTATVSSHLEPGAPEIQFIDLDFYSYPYLDARWQEGSPSGHRLQEYLENFFRVNFQALHSLTENLSTVDIDLVYSHSTGIPLGALYAARFGRSHVWNAEDEPGGLGEAQHFWRRFMKDFSDLILLASPAGTALYGPRNRVLPAEFACRALSAHFREAIAGTAEMAKGDGHTSVFIQQLLHLEMVIQMRDAEIASLKSVLRARDEELDSIRPVLQARDEELASMRPVLRAREAEIASLKSALKAREEELESLKLQL